MSAWPVAVVDMVWERANDCCERCGRGLLRGNPYSTPYSIQHRRACQAGGSKDPITRSVANGALLCGSATSPGGCHLWAERRPKESHGFVLASWQDPRREPILLWSGETVFLSMTGTYEPLPDIEEAS